MMIKKCYVIKERKIKDAFKGVIPGLIVSLILMAVVLFGLC